jgi:hypothetical protein
MNWAKKFGFCGLIGADDCGSRALFSWHEWAEETKNKSEVIAR